MTEIDKVDMSRFWHSTTTNLLHPAVVGAGIVKLLDLLVSGHLHEASHFQIVASVGLIYYFILEYWVIRTDFDDEPGDGDDEPDLYGVRHFLLDVISLATLTLAFYALWHSKNGLQFLMALSVLVISWIVWSFLRDGWQDTVTSKYTLFLVLTFVAVVAPVFSVWLVPGRLVHLITIHVSAFWCVVALGIYTWHVFYD